MSLQNKLIELTNSLNASVKTINNIGKMIAEMICDSTMKKKEEESKR